MSSSKVFPKWGGARVGSHWLRARPARVGNNASTPADDCAASGGCDCLRPKRHPRRLRAGRDDLSGVRDLLLRGDFHAGLYTPVAHALTPTLYGWIAEWNTTDAPNASFDLFAIATVNGTSDSSSGFLRQHAQRHCG